MKTGPKSRLPVLPQAKTLLGILCAGLVLLLCVLAASPDAHEQVCHHESTQQETDGACAVDLFAHGVDPGLAPVIETAPSHLEEERVATALERRLPNSAGLLPFACGPPLV